MARGLARRWIVLFVAAAVVAVAASVADAVLGHRAGSQAVAWLLGGVLALGAGRRVLALLLPATLMPATVAPASQLPISQPPAPVLPTPIDAIPAQPTGEPAPGGVRTTTTSVP